MTHIAVPDVSGLDSAVASVLSDRLPVYFVPQGAGNKTLFAIVKGAEQVGQDHFSTWRCLTKNKSLFSVCLFYTDVQKVASGQWDAEIINPFVIDELKDHPVTAAEIVLRVHRPDAADKTRGPDFKVKIFGDKAAANYDEIN
ncbi:hypothetical protein B0T18DRAFT_236638 [Schizothecium vesticola]|uniref:Uncharacterized protein n=1 Tax=Schizothecium vesticola TaxID=314040 RepID=A0AA40BPF2_9PEZI|nr:hypothetical protein B0T18DRAFT_236638 [Schizothecium vesticola]